MLFRSNPLRIKRSDLMEYRPRSVRLPKSGIIGIFPMATAATFLFPEVTALILRGNLIHGIDYQNIDRPLARFELQPHILLNGLKHRAAVALIAG